MKYARTMERGSVLIIVLWVCLGLVALTLYFANSMSAELHAADNRASENAARQALMGGVRYANYVLTNYATGGVVPVIYENQDYKAEALPVGDATFWFIGRDNDNVSSTSPTEPFFALVDESSKLNLNTVSSATLQLLPNMTPDLADAIVAWRNTNSQSVAAAGADNTYTQLDPPRHNKGGPFETTDELRLINGATLDLLLGEDTNRNGVLDPNEDDGENSAPRDNQDGILDAGLLEYVTVYSRLPANGASGQRRIDLTTLDTQQTRTQLQTRLQRAGMSADRIQQIIQRINTRMPLQNAGPGGPGRGGGQQPGGGNSNPFTSVMDFMLTTQMTADEFALVHTEFTVTTATNGTQDGLVNVNTASATVLACIQGIGTNYASSLVAYRQAHPEALTSFAWMSQIMPADALRSAGRFITDQSYQFTADIAAVATNGRGYCRERIVFDTSTGTPRIVYRQDLTPFGWALGATLRRSFTTTGRANST